ncbi:TnsA-like heteromeric transposase endonuclease subunit [Streptomyces sp. NPDC020883]|uniref:TnsA-like heteromeric transposase endonuclease subunit n=1 Tax=Streptomyces sp. NPDC020883 TaxID=3365099 RepID=UPI00379E4246
MGVAAEARHQGANDSCPSEALLRQQPLRTRQVDGSESAECAFGETSPSSLFDASPWRTFRWHLRQKHYSGSVWSATEQELVIYESRLELARLLFADFDPDVSRIVAQPFLVTGYVDGAVRKHIPDFLLRTTKGPLVVDVKPAHRVSRPDVAVTFGRSRLVIESRGWGYQVWSEPPVERLENLRFLAGYRRAWLFDPVILEALRLADLDGATLAAAFTSVPVFEPDAVRSAAFHLLWADDMGLSSVVRSQLGLEERRQLLERAEHVREVLYGYRSGSCELARASRRRGSSSPASMRPSSPLIHSCASRTGLSGGSGRTSLCVRFVRQVRPSWARAGHSCWRTWWLIEGRRCGHRPQAGQVCASSTRCRVQAIDQVRRQRRVVPGCAPIRAVPDGR